MGRAEAAGLQAQMGQTEFNLPGVQEFKASDNQDYMAGIASVLGLAAAPGSSSMPIPPIPIPDSQNPEKERGGQSPAVEADYDKLERLVAAFT